jgi:hypothetical protein
LTAAKFKDLIFSVSSFSFSKVANIRKFHDFVWLLSVGQSVKLLLAFASTVIPRFNLLEIHDQDFYSLLDIYVFQNVASSSEREG